MKKENFIVHPYYQGGNAAMEKLIAENLKYPESALMNRVEGTISIKYNVDHRGHVIAVKVVAGIGYGCDEEAIRLVKLLKFIVPRQPKGLKVIFNKEIHIHFRSPKVAPQLIKQPEYTPISPPQYFYSYNLSTIKKEIKTNQKPLISYTMTIKI